MGQENTYTPNALQEWLNDPNNKSNPYYNEAQALASTVYNGPGTTPLDQIYSIFGQTPYEKGMSQFKQWQEESWRELLGKINEYKVNNPAHLASLNKMAGYNVDLMGGNMQPINADSENPVTPPDYGGIGGGREMLGGAIGTLSGIVKDAFALLNSGMSLKGMKLQNRALELGNTKIDLDNDEKELQLGNLTKGYALNYAKSLMKSGTFGVDPKGQYKYVEDGEGKGEGFIDLNVGTGIEDFLKNGKSAQQAIGRIIMDKVDSEEFPFSSYGERNIKRFKEQLRAYINSDEFATDIFKTYTNREKAFQEAVKTRASGIGESTGANSYKEAETGITEALGSFKPLYQLEIKALQGDYQKRQYDGERTNLLFDKEKFEYDMQETMRDVLVNIKQSADNGDEFSKYLMFTMVTDPKYFQELNTIIGGAADFISDLNPFGNIGNLFKSLKKGTKGKAKAPKRTRDNTDIKN